MFDRMLLKHQFNDMRMNQKFCDVIVVRWMVAGGNTESGASIFKDEAVHPARSESSELIFFLFSL
jgi:hypothetical protein